MHVFLDPEGREIHRIVLPKCRRQNVLKLAHDGTAHVGCRGMRKLIGQKFTWPGVYVDIVAYVKSCSTCLRMNATGNKKVKMVERSIVFVPFETVAVDLVGPLPKGRHGSGGRYRVVGIDTSILPEESVWYRYQSGIEQTSIPNPAQTEYRPLPTSHCGQH